jgi:cysteine desulfurase
MKQAIYLDYNASSPLRPSAREVMLDALKAPLNASSIHGYGREGRRIIEQSRSIIAAAVGCPAAQLVFNSGATEGNNTVLRHFASAYPDEQILVGASDHPSVIEVLLKAGQIPVDENGVTDLAALEVLLKDRKTSLVSVMWANNETGVIQPVAEIAKLAHRHGALFHCDATQALGRIDIDMARDGVDFLTLSSHKIGGPQGVGALAMGLCGVTPILLHGGGQEKKARAGTENIAGIAGFGAACEVTTADITGEAARLRGLQAMLEDGIRKIASDAVIFGEKAARMSNTTLFSVAGMKAESLLMNFDLEGFAVSNGSACTSGTVKASHVLQAMGIEKNMAGGAIRVSTGWATQTSDIEVFLKVWEKIYIKQNS